MNATMAKTMDMFVKVQVVLNEFKQKRYTVDSPGLDVAELSDAVDGFLTHHKDFLETLVFMNDTAAEDENSLSLANQRLLRSNAELSEKVAKMQKMTEKNCCDLETIERMLQHKRDEKNELIEQIRLAKDHSKVNDDYLDQNKRLACSSKTPVGMSDKLKELVVLAEKNKEDIQLEINNHLEEIGRIDRWVFSVREKVYHAMDDDLDQMLDAIVENVDENDSDIICNGLFDKLKESGKDISEAYIPDDFLVDFRSGKLVMLQDLLWRMTTRRQPLNEMETKVMGRLSVIVMEMVLLQSLRKFHKEHIQTHLGIDNDITVLLHQKRWNDVKSSIKVYEKYSQWRNLLLIQRALLQSYGDKYRDSVQHLPQYNAQ